MYRMKNDLVQQTSYKVILHFVSADKLDYWRIRKLSIHRYFESSVAVNKCGNYRLACQLCEVYMLGNIIKVSLCFVPCDLDIVHIRIDNV